MEPFEAAELMRSCCASRRWISEVVMGRPYGSMRRLTSASADVLADLGWSDIVAARSAQLRIGGSVNGPEHADLLSALQHRLAGSSDNEREIVRDELREIVRLRLIKTFR
jgi:2-oxo-4-hydroxy-4-carboxy-5-ureidoimidazoline decarboxylase